MFKSQIKIIFRNRGTEAMKPKIKKKKQLPQGKLCFHSLETRYDL